MKAKTGKGTSAEKVKPYIHKVTWRQDFTRNKALYFVMLPCLIYFIIFNYIPMFGILMAFEDFSVTKGFFGSKWVGFDNFRTLFTGEAFLTALRNTVCMALLNLTIGFVMPIVFAFLISEIRTKKFKRSLQTVSYMPYFIAAVVVVQLVKEFIGTDGAITAVLTLFGLPKQNWLANPNIPVFWLINCLTDVWQGMGYGSIMYVAAMSQVSGDYHEAAVLDGANRWQRVTKITLPCIMPTIIMLFTLRIGLVFVTGFDKVLLMYMPTTYVTSDVLSTYTYRMAFGVGTPNYGLSAASGLFQSVVGMALLLISNKLSKKVTDKTVF